MSNPSQAAHVLFVCTGNTCRSPMAEAFFRKALNGRTDITVSSAGVSAYTGSPASDETLSLVSKHGTSLEGFCSTEISASVVDSASIIFCLTRRHARTLLAAFPALDDSNVFLVGDFVEINGKVGNDIPDPFGMGPAAYEKVAEILNQAVPNLIAFIDQRNS